jgi:hypothetical protein
MLSQLSFTLTMLIKQLLSIGATDRQPANVIRNNLNAAASEITHPTKRRLRQIEAEHRQRNKLRRNLHLHRKRLNGRRITKHIYFSKIK